MSEIEEEEELATVAQLKSIETSLKTQIAKTQPRPTSSLPIVAALAAAIGLAGGYIGAQFAGAQGEKGDTGAQGIQGDKGDRGEPGIDADIPENAVVAFDDSAGCPDGWKPFLAAQSRAIIGATFGIGSEPGLGNNENDVALIERKYRDHGGEESVTLAQNHLPEHRHGVPYGPSDSGSGFHPILGQGKASTPSNYPQTTFVGNNQPHNNMPPYIALYFCQKT